jgi:hypothetical protein
MPLIRPPPRPSRLSAAITLDLTSIVRSISVKVRFRISMQTFSHAADLDRL